MRRLLSIVYENQAYENQANVITRKLQQSILEIYHIMKRMERERFDSPDLITSITRIKDAAHT